MTTTQQATLPADLAHDERLRLTRAGIDDDVTAQTDKLSDGHGNRLRHGHGHPMDSLLDGLTASLVAAGFVVHDCAAKDRAGGVCRTPTTAQPTGVIVTWTTHDFLTCEPGRYRENSDVHDLMNFTLADVLCARGWATQPFGHAGAHLVTRRLGEQEPTDD